MESSLLRTEVEMGLITENIGGAGDSRGIRAICGLKSGAVGEETSVGGWWCTCWGQRSLQLRYLKDCETRCCVSWYLHEH